MCIYCGRVHYVLWTEIQGPLVYKYKYLTMHTLPTGVVQLWRYSVVYPHSWVSKQSGIRAT